MQIDNGWGDGGWKQRVNSDGQAFTQSEIHAEAREHSRQGQFFLFATSFIPLTTTGSFSAIFYIKNTSTTKTLHIGKLRTCSDQVCEWKFIKNPTTGTLISDATAAAVENMNFGSSVLYVGDVYKGADAKTITDGVEAGTWINNIGHSQPDWEGAIMLGPGDSIALSVKPAVAGDACVTVSAWQNGD